MVKKWGDAELYCTHLYLLFLLPIVSTVKSKDSLYLLEKGLLNISSASVTCILIMVFLLQNLYVWSSNTTLHQCLP